MEKLIALTNIWYKGRSYIPGEEIREYTPEMAEAWKRAGSVKVLKEADPESPKEENGTAAGNNKPETSGSESVNETGDANTGEKPSTEEPGGKEPVKKGRNAK